MEQRLTNEELEHWLDQNQEAWMGPLRNMATDEPSIAFMRTCGAMVESLRDAHEGLIFTKDTMTVLQARTWTFVEALNYGEFQSADEWPRGDWFGNIDVCRAAAVLAESDQVEAVLVTASLMSQGYDYNGGPNRALTDGYTELLPAIVSAISPRAEGFSIPWFRASGGINVPRTSGTIRALAPGLTNEARALLLGTGDEPWTDKSVLDYVFFPVAQAMGLDLSHYPQARIDDAMETLDSTLKALAEDPDDDDELDTLGELYLALFVSKYAAELLNSPAGLTQQEMIREYPWLYNWRPWQVTTEAVWPPSLEDLRDAVFSN